MSQRQVLVELGRGSAEMAPIRTDNKPDEVGGGEGTTAPGNGRMGLRAEMGRAPQGPCPGKRMRRPWTAHRHKAAVSSCWLEKLAWDTGQAGTPQNRLGDCFLKPQIFYMAFSGPSTATRSCSPIQKTLKKMLVFSHMCPCLASLRLPWSLSSVAFSSHSYSTSRPHYQGHSPRDTSSK